MSTEFALGDLSLRPGEAMREQLDIEVRPYLQAGEHYSISLEKQPITLDITRMQKGGLSLRMRADVSVHGPCARCLGDAKLDLEIDAREVHEPESGDDELISDFVDGSELRLTDWMQDAIGLEFPQRVLCQEDCAGLCPQCGTNWNEADCDCAPPATDSRWDKLRELDLGE